MKVDTSKPTVGEANSEIARVQGTKESRQELYKVAESADGKAMREDDVSTQEAADTTAATMKTEQEQEQAPAEIKSTSRDSSSSAAVICDSCPIITAKRGSSCDKTICRPRVCSKQASRAEGKGPPLNKKKLFFGGDFPLHFFLAFLGVSRQGELKNTKEAVGCGPKKRDLASKTFRNDRPAFIQ
jgi:hypothetical protein